ncbi:titin-like [Pollicipes pollicipes]|uniref:titin-like n=1 Tax=Pollicipes pollicipes TaxID=41117 RepID=UPI0018852257|nr:titin-like [Pollicipes pollicipes]
MERRLRWSILLLAAATLAQGRVQQIDITGLVGDEVRLPCEIDETKCGDVHNIQWYRGDGDTRVFIYSELAEVDTSENMLQGRGYFEYAKGSSTTELEIRDLRPDDESLYKCELTYLEVRDDCAVIQFVNLTTLAKPESIRILLEDGTEVSPGSVIGPYEEDSDLVLRCESAGGKPAAAVTWWNDTVNMGGDAGAILSEDGTGLGTNVIRVPLTRHDLGSGFECQATNAAVEYPLRSKIYLDLHVRPRTIELSGLEEPVMEGATVTLTCKVTGARPAANITWLTGGQELTEQTSNTDSIQPDSTTETISRYTFTADRTTNGQHIVCEAANAVIKNKAESPLQAPVKVEVLYAPVVTVTPSNVTVNESMDILLLCSYDANPTNLTAVFWYKSGRQLDLTDEDKYKGGTLEQPLLLIENASRHDAGRYRCEVANEIGGGMADNEAVVHVQFPPDVVLTMSPSSVIEADQENVTFRCDVTAGEPAELLGVRWYLDGELLRELPECNDTDPGLAYDSLDEGNEDFCNSNPAEMIFLKVDRTFLANYSCSGMNSAGWGPVSTEKEFIIHYPPLGAALVYEPATVLKGSAVTLTCEVDDPGYPPASKYIWMRGNHVITDVTDNTWRISTVSLEDDANFSCVAMNQAGSSGEGQAALDVLTKPQFIERLPLYMGALMNSSSIAVTCRVECSPLCELEWLKDDQVIEDGSYYSIKTGALEPDPRTNDFESVVSTLTWNMTAWPNQTLDRVRDNANYTCRSTSNTVGPGVSSTTLFTVEYPPEDIAVTLPVVDVVEGEKPSPVRCTANAYPAATYIWKHGDVPIQTGDQLDLNFHEGINREQAGEYVCHAQNKHGIVSTPVFVNVMYVPECSIGQMEQDWRVPARLHGRRRARRRDLHLALRQRDADGADPDRGHRHFGTYYCLVNNSIGPGLPCEIDVAGGGWGMRLGDMSLIIVIVVVVVALVLLLIIGIVIILCCRRKRAKDKYGAPNALEERENPDGTSSSLGGQGVQPLHKWPIRPGVHVHVTSVQSLTKLSDAPPDVAAPPATQEKVVTFRRVETDSDSKEDNLDTVGDPSKSKSSPNGAHPPDDRAVYENLPFHGMQQPPSKSTEGGQGRSADSSQSRPPSELSQNGSSGYGSTFSQGNPQYGSMRSQHSFQYGSTRSQRADPERHGQQLLPIPQSPDLPDTPTTHDKTTQSEANNNDCERPTPPQRGPAAKPPYHNLSLPYRGHRARQRQAQNQADFQQQAQNQTERQRQGDSFEMWEQVCLLLSVFCSFICRRFPTSLRCVVHLPPIPLPHHLFSYTSHH